MVFRNHDLVGIEGIIRAQKNEIEKKKVRSNICLLTVTVVGAEDRKREVLPRAPRTGKHGPAVYLQSARRQTRQYFAVRGKFLRQGRAARGGKEVDRGVKRSRKSYKVFERPDQGQDADRVNFIQLNNSSN